MVSPFEEWEGEFDGKKAKFGRPNFEPLSNESTALNIEEAIRLNASILAVQVFIGSAYERQSLKNLTDLVDAASRYGIAVMGVTAVGRAMAARHSISGSPPASWQSLELMSLSVTTPRLSSIP